MQTVKERLSVLTNTIISELPDENDLKGLPGVSRALLIDFLKKASALADQLIPFDSAFETIVLKRDLADLFDSLQKSLGEKWIKINKGEFHSIVRKITRIQFLMKECYISLVNDLPIRTEQEIIAAREELKNLQENISELKKVAPEILQLKDKIETNASIAESAIEAKKDGISKFVDSIQDDLNGKSQAIVSKISNTEAEMLGLKQSGEKIVAELGAHQEKASKNEEATNTFLTEVEKHKTAIDQTRQSVNETAKTISKTEADLMKLSEEHTLLKKRSEELFNEIEKEHLIISGNEEDPSAPKGYIEEARTLIKQINDFYDNQKTKYQTQFDEIKSLLPGATSVGLASAYYEQKQSYRNAIKWWSVAFILTIATMVTLSLIILIKQFKAATEYTLNGAFISLLKDLPFFIPTIWLAAFASKQHSKATRMQQEYAFKEANAKSFEGLKIQIEKLMKDNVAEKELLERLVAQLVVITGQNPSTTLDHTSHNDSPPIFKLAEQFLGKGKGKNGAENKTGSI